jgi:hypothetical protein
VTTITEFTDLWQLQGHIGQYEQGSFEKPWSDEHAAIDAAVFPAGTTGKSCPFIAHVADCTVRLPLVSRQSAALVGIDVYRDILARRPLWQDGLDYRFVHCLVAQLALTSRLGTGRLTVSAVS